MRLPKLMFPSCVCTKHKCYEKGYCTFRCKGIKPQSCDE